jgi:hypothetical protein
MLNEGIILGAVDRLLAELGRRGAGRNAGCAPLGEVL